MNEREAYDQLCGYTLLRGDRAFIHQHVVDVFAAQTADEHTKPIKLTFALVGLYLHELEGFTGKQVQRAHQYLARGKQSWPTFLLPSDRGSISAIDVLAQPAGMERDEAIYSWLTTVWSSYGHVEEEIRTLLSKYPGLFPYALSGANKSS